jgi:hypothetical protein
MSPNRPDNGHGAYDGEDVEGVVEDALISLGWIVPQTEADVLRAESEIGLRPVPLAEGLANPASAWEHQPEPRRPRPEILQFPGDEEIAADLARAAREGGRIPPELEEILRRDREAAERERDGDAEND